MKKTIFLIIAMILFGGIVNNAFAALTLTYDWEDGGTVLGEWGSVKVANVSDYSRSGSSSLELIDDGGLETPMGYVGWVTGLTDGDKVTAGVWVYDTTIEANPSGRIWGQYTNEEMDHYYGTALGNTDYSDGTGWSYLEHTWTYDSAENSHEGLAVGVRVYGTMGSTIWIDDLTITAPDGASIELAGTASLASAAYFSASSQISQVPVPGAVWLLGSGILAMAGLRKKRRE